MVASACLICDAKTRSILLKLHRNLFLPCLSTLASAWTPFKSYTYNKEEINQISAFLASTDDGGDVKIIDIRQHCLYKTLRAGHSSICSSVQFIPWRSWEVITGGLDSKLVMWDFSKGRPVKIVDFGLPDTKNSSNGAQCLNPAFVHAIAVPDVDMLDKSDKICVVARGDGVVDVINIESELAVIRSKTSAKARKGSSSTSKDGVPAAGTGILDENARKRLHLDYSVGGHAAAVSCVTFSLFGEKGKLIISGGNDKSVKVWDCSKYDDAVQTGGNSDVLRLNINLSKKEKIVSCLSECCFVSKELLGYPRAAFYSYNQFDQGKVHDTPATSFKAHQQAP